MRLLYDVAHNIAKMEEFPVAGRMQRVCVHRKGATRALPPRHPLLPSCYRENGQPVLIPGDMASGGFVLAGGERAYPETFGSCCHGAGREMSRAQALKSSKGRAIAQDLRRQGVVVMATSKATLGEEIPEAYKRVEEVVEIVHKAGIATKVARLQTLARLKD